MRTDRTRIGKDNKHVQESVSLRVSVAILLYALAGRVLTQSDSRHQAERPEHDVENRYDLCGCS